MRDKRARHANVTWNFPTTAAGNIASWEFVQIAVLMDLRDELQRLNRLLHCPNFIAIPRKLDAIHRKIPTQRRRAKK